MQLTIPIASEHEQSEQPRQSAMPWVRVCKDSPYFETEGGQAWTPIGQNDALTWPDLQGLYRRRDMAGVENYLRSLSAHGVTCLRLMLEYSQHKKGHFETPDGVPRRVMVQVWDDLFRLCEIHGLRILLTPVDSFWMWIRWKTHPWNAQNGGPCADRRRLLLCRYTRKLLKERLAFVIERWGGSGVLFAWDLWNEIHPSYAEDSAACFDEFIHEMSGFVRSKELELYGKSHPQTVSVFSPHMVLDSRIPESIFRHPALDFASTHFYEEGTIDHPKNTVDAAVSTARLMREYLSEVRDGRPFLDSEHGPIHTFKDHHRTLPAPFDEEYFRHIQWSHFAAGGAGGGMRWPNRKPHCLTPGMRDAQRALAGFLPLIDWHRFRRHNWNQEVRVSDRRVTAAACGDLHQAIVYLLRTDQFTSRLRRGMVRRDAPPVAPRIEAPGLLPGSYRVTAWDTVAGRIIQEFTAGPVFEAPPFVADLALAIVRAD